MTEPLRVESFNLDHRLVAAPYLRLAARKELPHGDVITKYDVRFTQPNKQHLDMSIVHSIEHLFAENVRAHSDQVIDFSPMGCQTGFYLILAADLPWSDVADLVAATMQDLMQADHVPGANTTQCGWGVNHDLIGAQYAVKQYLAARDTWAQIFAAEPISAP